MEKIVFNAENVRRINLGHGNDRLERCVKENVLAYGVARKAYDLYRENLKEEVLSFYESQISWRTERYVTKSSASRYLNHLDYFVKTGPETLWLAVGKTRLFWGSASGAPEIIGHYDENNPNANDDRYAYLIAKKMDIGWHDHTITGSPLDLWRMHPKAKDWLTQRGTIGRLNTAQYFIDLINGEQLNAWHDNIEMVRSAHEVGWRETSAIPEVPKDWGYEIGRMASNIMRTIANANGQIVSHATKIKNSSHSESEWHIILREVLLIQNYRCNITGKKLEIKGTGSEWLKPSVDRINSAGHYHKNNIQIVSWAVNKAKSDVGPQQFPDYFNAIQIIEHDKD